MGWTTGVAIYVIIWWVVLFMVLPFGVRPIEQDDVAKGHASSAPRRPRVIAKMLATSVLAAAVWAVVYFLIDSGWIGVRS
jgi:predicted secreted protein